MIAVYLLTVAVHSARTATTDCCFACPTLLLLILLCQHIRHHFWQVLNKILTHARPTGYNALGVCVPKKSMAKDADRNDDNNQDASA
jgi:hypothetical protein